jgi:general secretion pathway protein L
MDTLLIHFDPATPDHATWSLVNSAGELTTLISSGPPENAAPLADKHKTIVLLDNTAVHINTVQLPIKNRQKLLRAVPFALEEQLADDVDDLHFVAGKPLQDGIVPVAAIKRDTLKDILSTLNKAGIEPTAIIPDALCLTASSKQWSILLHGNTLKVQLDSFKGGEFDKNIIPTLLSSNLEKQAANKPEKIIFFTPEEKSEDDDEAKTAEEVTDSISNCIGDDIEFVNVSYNTHPLVIYCGQYQHAMPLNLLQDAYKPTKKGDIEWKRWRLAASLAAVFLCLHLGSAGAQYYDLLEKNNQLRAEINNIYKKTFPQSKKIVNARVQMEQKLNELKGASSDTSSGDVIELLASSANALSSEKNITLQSISFRNNRMDIELTGTNLQAVESLNKMLNTQKEIKAEIITSSSEKNRVKGSIRIQKAKS